MRFTIWLSFRKYLTNTLWHKNTQTHVHRQQTCVCVKERDRERESQHLKRWRYIEREENVPRGFTQIYFDFAITQLATLTHSAFRPER